MISDTQLLFLPGFFTLKKDFILESVNNISIIGNQSIIKCFNSSVGIVIVNVTNFILQNLEIIQCGKKYNDNIANTLDGTTSGTSDLGITPCWRAGIHMHYCSYIFVSNVSINVDIGTDGIFVLNAIKSEFIDVFVIVTSSECYENSTSTTNKSDATTSTTNGFVIRYHKSNRSTANEVSVQNFVFQQRVCFHSENQEYNVFHITFTQNKHKIKTTIVNTVITGLYNSRVLSYYIYTSKKYDPSYIVKIINCTVYNNMGNNLTDLIVALIEGESLQWCIVQTARKTIVINNSTFYNNLNIHSLIAIENLQRSVARCRFQITIVNCCFNYNHIMNIIKDSDEQRHQLRRLIYLMFSNTTIISNTHNNGSSLISLNIGQVLFHKMTIASNSYYEHLVQINYSSFMIISGFVLIWHNCVRIIFKMVEVSYIKLNSHCTLVVKQNTVYTVFAQEMIHKPRQLCYFQCDTDASCQFKIAIVNNTYMAPIHLIAYQTYFKNCEWTADGSTSTEARSHDVLSPSIHVMESLSSIDKEEIGIIPSSICRCTQTFQYECKSHRLNQVFPGQTLMVDLIVPKLIFSSSNTITLMVETAHLPSNSCTIVRASEMSQMHTNTRCNQYNYTVWSDKTECELYLSSDGIPEMFYIKLLPCPVGFSLQSHVQRCHCDPVLNCDVISVTTCNLIDGTILRPANSWISADTTNGSHRYHVSPQCPFDYCLPYSSYVDLSTPDMQCQFNRSGVLCGHCQLGLSAAFGSSQCKKCSNIYLLIMVPIVIAGIVLVMMLFQLDLTVANGTITTFVFYVNIISMNYSTLLPNCHSPICILLSIFNLDLGIKTCFYSNMSNYAKTCLQLAFPFYLIAIALALIMGSRYFSRIQRLTARRGLHVLATLFLLSYTKILSMVCHVLFFYTQITHLPSRHIQYFWSVDTSVELFEAKFIILFVACLLILAILIPFNALLLFTRSLLRFKLISSFKPLLDPYLGPYKDKYFYWTGIQIFMRAVFFGLSAFNHEVSLVSGVVVIGVLHCVQGIIHPFKSRFNNIQESLFLLNLLLIYIITSHNYYNNDNIAISEYLILIAFVYFIFFIVYIFLTTLFHSSMQKLRGYISARFRKRINSAFKLSQKSTFIDIPDVTFNYKEFREPLIAVTK